MTARRDVVKLEELEREVAALKLAIGALEDALAELARRLDEATTSGTAAPTDERRERALEKKRAYARAYNKRKRAANRAPQVAEAG